MVISSQRSVWWECRNWKTGLGKDEGRLVHLTIQFIQAANSYSLAGVCSLLKYPARQEIAYSGNIYKVKQLWESLFKSSLIPWVILRRHFELTFGLRRLWVDIRGNCRLVLQRLWAGVWDFKVKENPITALWPHHPSNILTFENRPLTQQPLSCVSIKLHRRELATHWWCFPSSSPSTSIIGIYVCSALLSCDAAAILFSFIVNFC